MKKFILFSFLLSFSLSVISQIKSPVAVKDTVYIDLGETYTIYPLVNDYDPDGGDLIIEECTTGYPNTISILQFSDTSITFKVIDYAVGESHHFSLRYKLASEEFTPYCQSNITMITEIPHDILLTNDIKARIFPQNIQFWNAYARVYDDSHGFMYPADEKTSTIFSYGLWVGGLDENDQLHLAAETFRQRGVDFWSGPLSDDGLATTDTANCGNWFRTWKVDRSEIYAHIANFQDASYEMPEAIASWPAHGDPALNQAEMIAPFVDVDGDLEYHPELGDYPFIKGDQSIFFVYNDQLEHTESEGAPLGVEIHCMAWAIDEVKSSQAYGSTIFMSYKIFNKSDQTYHDTYIGTFADFDIGNSANDLVGCHVENGNYFGYNGTETDPDMPNGVDTTFGYGSNIPTQSICILGGPFLDADGIDNPSGSCNESINGAGFGDGIIDNEMHGMSHFIYFYNADNQYSPDPQYAAEYYNYMKGIWQDGSAMVYGGNGHVSNGGNADYPARFMYPGDSDVCHWGTNGLDHGMGEWTEITAGNNPTDTRGTSSIGPFTFEPGSVHYLDIALVTAPGDAGKSSKDLVQDYIAQIKQDYLVNPSKFGNQYVGIEETDAIKEEIKVYPNPVDGDIINFELTCTQNTEYKIYNTAGQVIISGNLEQSIKNHQINIGELQSGWYILEINNNGRILHSKIIK